MMKAQNPFNYFPLSTFNSILEKQADLGIEYSSQFHQNRRNNTGFSGLGSLHSSLHWPYWFCYWLLDRNCLQMKGRHMWALRAGAC